MHAISAINFFKSGARQLIKNRGFVAAASLGFGVWLGCRLTAHLRKAESLENRIIELSTEPAAAKKEDAQKQALQSELKKNEQKRQELEDQIRSLESEKEDLKKKAKKEQKLAAEVLSLKNEKGELENKNSALKRSLEQEQLKNTLDAVSPDPDLLSENTDLKNTLKSKTLEYSRLIDEHQLEIRALKKTIDDLYQKIDRLSASLERQVIEEKPFNPPEAKPVQEAVKPPLSEDKAELDPAKKDLFNLDSTLTQKLKEILTLQKQVESLSVEKTGFHGELLKLKVLLDIQQRELEQLRKAHKEEKERREADQEWFCKQQESDLYEARMEARKYCLEQICKELELALPNELDFSKIAALIRARIKERESNSKPISALRCIG